MPQKKKEKHGLKNSCITSRSSSQSTWPNRFMLEFWDFSDVNARPSFSWLGFHLQICLEGENYCQWKVFSRAIQKGMSGNSIENSGHQTRLQDHETAAWSWVQSASNGPYFSFLVKRTPAETWIHELKGKKDPDEIPLPQNLTNLIDLQFSINMVVYIDTGFIIMKPLTRLRNSIGAQSTSGF